MTILAFFWVFFQHPAGLKLFRILCTMHWCCKKWAIVFWNLDVTGNKVTNAKWFHRRAGSFLNCIRRIGYGVCRSLHSVRPEFDRNKGAYFSHFIGLELWSRDADGKCISHCFAWFRVSLTVVISEIMSSGGLSYRHIYIWTYVSYAF